MRQQYTEYRTGTADHRPSLHLLPSDIEKFDLTTSFFGSLLILAGYIINNWRK